MSLGVKRSAVRVMDMEMQAPADGWPRRPSLLHTLQRLLCPFFISWLRLITKLKLGTSDYSVVTGEFSMPSILHTCQHTMTPFCDNELFPLLLDHNYWFCSQSWFLTALAWSSYFDLISFSHWNFYVCFYVEVLLSTLYLMVLRINLKIYFNIISWIIMILIDNCMFNLIPSSYFWFPFLSHSSEPILKFFLTVS